MAFETSKFEYPRRIYFVCNRCALCCGDTERRIRSIFIMRSEADRISRKTFKEIAEFAERIEGFEPYAYIIRKTDQGRCIFLKDNTCMIYPARPLVCRFYPFELNMEGTKHVFAYSAECPAIGKGPRVKKEYFRRLFEMAKMQMKKDTEARRSATTAVRKRKSRRTGR